MTSKSTYVAALMLVAAFAATSAPAAEPSLHEVYQTAESGRVKEALGMMDQVLRDHPSSAKAHFVEAELLVKDGRLSQAQAELAAAEKLQPGLPFANAQAVSTLKARIQGNGSAGGGLTRAVAPAPSGGMPWGLIMLAIAAIGAIVLFTRSRARPAPGMVGGPMGGPGYGMPAQSGPMMPGGMPGGGMMGGGGGLGSGIMGGLATGAAVGAGMVAGEALAHRLMDGGERPHHVVDNPGSSTGAVPWDVGPDTPDQQDFGVSDGGWDDSGGGGGDWN
jgi:uncharacterized protein